MLDNQYAVHNADPSALTQPVNPSQPTRKVLSDLLSYEGCEGLLAGISELLRAEVTGIQKTVIDNPGVAKEDKLPYKEKAARLERVARLVERGAELAMKL